MKVRYDCSGRVRNTCVNISVNVCRLRENMKLVTAALLELSDYLRHMSPNNIRLHLMSEVSLPWPVMAHLIFRLMEWPPRATWSCWNEHTPLTLAYREAASATPNRVVVISTTLDHLSRAMVSLISPHWLDGKTIMGGKKMGRLGEAVGSDKIK